MYVQAGTMGHGWAFNKKGKLLGYAFGSDATTEHECGYASIRDDFGVELKELGIEGRRIQTIPSSVQRLEDLGDVYLIFNLNWDQSSLPPSELVYRTDWESLDRRERTTASAWSDTAFAIRSTGKDIPYLEELWKHLQAKNLALTSRSNGFMAAGLQLSIVSRFPRDENRKWIAKEREELALKEAWTKESAGLEDLLREKGLRWFHLGKTPHRGKDGVLRVLLNPFNQRTYRQGYYSVSELKQWAEGKGPVVQQ